jgi:hypothetical protein
MAVGSTARKPFGMQVAYQRLQIAYNSTATDTVTRYKGGIIPKGSQILGLLATVKTGFSAAGTRVLTAGTNGTTANNLLTTITEETATAVMPLIGAKLTLSSDTAWYGKLTTAGTAAAAGLAELVLMYVPPQEEQFFV